MLASHWFILTACMGGDNIGSSSLKDDTDTQVEDSAGEEILDTDGDGVVDDEDACPNDSEQWTDADGDGVCDEVSDKCPDDPNTWSDLDGDSLCDENDPCPEEQSNLDTDGDGVCDGADGCPEDATDYIDTDGDGVCDLSDDCPEVLGAVDSNQDGVCDGLDDSDGDGLTDGEENEFGADCLMSNPLLADSDDDGIDDSQDPYPRDPWPEYILFRNESGTIDMLLSNRTQSGTFQAEIAIGLEYGGSENTNYRYTQFVISDFDVNGQMDFLAIGDEDPDNNDNDVDIWYFWREKADTFQQRLLGTTSNLAWRTVADMNNDFAVDLVISEISRPNYYESVVLYTYENQKNFLTTSCFVSDDPANPEGCAFIRKEAVDLTSWISNQWVYNQSRDAVDFDGDGNRDLVVLKISSGSNTQVPHAILYGDGMGGLSQPQNLFTHNSGNCGASPANSILFSDFNGDGLGDIITGLDDDGDAGSAWFYPGSLNQGMYEVDSSGCTEAFDIAQTYESGSDNPGVTSSARNFDFDFDGIQDIVVGYRHQDAWSGDSRTTIFFGQGDGSFGPQHIIREFPGSNLASRFATPQRLCTWFPLSSE